MQYAEADRPVTEATAAQQETLRHHDTTARRARPLKIKIS
jgi:hypothetical protein